MLRKLINTITKTFLFTFTTFAMPLSAALPNTVDGQAVPSLAPMLEKITPAVVNISTEGRVKVRQNPLFADPFFQRFFQMPNQPLERKTQSLGSGVIVDANRGLVMTNNHVIANAVQITVTLRDGRQLEAELVGSDPETDVAVIKIPAENLTEVTSTDSDNIRVGDFVVAIGNPFGLGQTVTSGIISALSRSGLGIEGYEDFIQTDASINPGNSGGALVNLKGELVGINTAIFSQSGGNIGIGFAIPINLANQIMEQLLSTGTVKRGYLGVTAQDLNPDLAEAFGLKDQRGAVINEVLPESPADKAGIKAGDIILSIDGKKVKNANDVRNRIGLLPVDEKIEFEVYRNGQRKNITAEITVGKEDIGAPAAQNENLQGISIQDLDASHPYHGKVEGVIVVNVERGSPAWRSGLRQGDIITSVNKQDVSDVQSFIKKVDKLKGSLLFRIIRGNGAAFIVIK